MPGYGFQSADQEITHLFWLAETANVCAWATRGDADWFKLFSVRFLSEHLFERDRLALVSMVTQAGYEKAVRQAAEDGAGQNCASRRWEQGWTSYLSAASRMTASAEAGDDYRPHHRAGRLPRRDAPSDLQRAQRPGRRRAALARRLVLHRRRPQRDLYETLGRRQRQCLPNTGARADPLRSVRAARAARHASPGQPRPARRDDGAGADRPAARFLSFAATSAIHEWQARRAARPGRRESWPWLLPPVPSP